MEYFFNVIKIIWIVYPILGLMIVFSWPNSTAKKLLIAHFIIVLGTQAFHALPISVEQMRYMYSVTSFLSLINSAILIIALIEIGEMLTKLNTQNKKHDEI